MKLAGSLTTYAFAAIALASIAASPASMCSALPMGSELDGSEEAAAGGSYTRLGGQVPFLGSFLHGGEDIDSNMSKGKAKAKDGWVYLIRHGEKFKDDEKTGLSQRGIKRANCLKKVFSDRKHGIKHILAQDFKPDGRRRRPYETVKPLAKKLGLRVDHQCDRDDFKCATRYIKRRTQPRQVKRQADKEDDDIDELAWERGDNVLVVWEHARLSDIARRLGVTGLHYPSERYDVVFKVRHGKVHAIYSEGCDGLDDDYAGWHDEPHGKHGKGGHGGRLVDDVSWARPPDDD